MNGRIVFDTPDFPDKFFAKPVKSDNVEDLSQTIIGYSIPTITLYSAIIEKLDATFKDVIPELVGDQFENN